MPSIHDLLIWAIALGGIFGVLFRPRGIAEAWWAGGAAVLLVLAAQFPAAEAGRAVLKGWDVYLFLTGMMILSELAREEGVFDWIAEVAASHADGSPWRLFVLIYLAGTVVTVFLSNDATAVVLTPAVLAIVRRLKVPARPYLLACALIANAASFVLPISNPANLVIFGSRMPRLGEWLGAFWWPSVVAIVVTFVALGFLSRGALRGEITEKLAGTRLSTNGALALGGLVFAAGVLIAASALGWSLGLPTCAAAVVVAGVVACRDGSVPRRVLRGVAWSVLPLVAGLFVIVEALQSAGMLRVAVAGLDAAARLGSVAGNLATAFSVGLLSNVMNNLPVGLIGGAAVQAAGDHARLVHAVLIGVDLGPNLSITGSLATILWLIALRREGVAITGWEFLKVGLVVAPLALLGAILALGR